MENNLNDYRSGFCTSYYQIMVDILYTGNWVMEQIKSFVHSENITPQQFHILCILKEAGQPLSTLQIREKMPDKMSDTSRIVARLITKGYVQKEKSDKDKRLVDVTLTCQGRQVMETLVSRQMELDQVMQHLTEDETSQLRLLLKKIRSHQ
jgi:DNA-binding MarR family transcriptional regulator